MTREELIAALEKATGPDRELDEAIALLRHCAALPPGSPRPIAIINPAPYTDSIDAALTLVPEGWGASIFTAVGAAHVEEHTSFDDDQGVRCFGAEATTPALALCIAALKAQGGGA